jgi:hypothetical protein
MEGLRSSPQPSAKRLGIAESEVGPQGRGLRASPSRGIDRQRDRCLHKLLTATLPRRRVSAPGQSKHRTGSFGQVSGANRAERHGPPDENVRRSIAKRPFASGMALAQRAADRAVGRDARGCSDLLSMAGGCYEAALMSGKTNLICSCIAFHSQSFRDAFSHHQMTRVASCGAQRECGCHWRGMARN